jgi:hypothetical protein
MKGETEMKRRHALALTLILGLFMVHGGGSGGTSDRSGGNAPSRSACQTLQTRFLDSQTGYAVYPREVIIRDRAAGGSSLKVESSQIKSGGRLAVALNKGCYDLSVQAASYYPMVTWLCIEGEQVLTIEFHLDPIKLPAELDYDYVKSLQRVDATAIIGFVVNDETGEPLDGVRVSIAGDESCAFANDKGFFALRVPVATDTATIVFEKAGYTTEERRNIELWQNGDWMYRIRLTPGRGTTIVDERLCATDNCSQCSEEDEGTFFSQSNPVQSYHTDAIATSTLVLPGAIRVGRSCPTKYTCSSVEVYGLQTYCKRVLPAEVYSCWGSMSGGMNSLKADAVPVRTYGVYHVYYPLTSTYDICDYSACQAFGSAQSSNCNTAVDQTARIVLVDTLTSDIVMSEYSAENNDCGCGDGYSGTGTTWPCIYDPVCTGFAAWGHGRGLCQYGSVRWATGTVVTRLSPCSIGVPHAYGTKTWEEILAHYYPIYQIVEAASASITDADPLPASLPPGDTFSILYSINANAPLSAILDASIARTGTTDWITDPANSIKVGIPIGTSSPTRDFAVPPGASTGLYDLSVALQYDMNNNNVIDSGDFPLDTKLYSCALSVATPSPTPTLTPTPTPTPMETPTAVQSDWTIFQ